MAVRTLINGFPRIGENRELKKVLENYWAHKAAFDDVEKTAAALRGKHWRLQKDAGIDFISSNDFSLYDGMLDTIVMLNAIPERFVGIADKNERYFAMARGNGKAAAMEMTKWFNTNYHFIVPELRDDMVFQLEPKKIISEYREAKAMGVTTKINLIGPLTFLELSKTKDGNDSFTYLHKIMPVYKQLLEEIAKLDESVYVQFDEPGFVKNPSGRMLSLLRESYQELAAVSGGVKIIVTSYFEHSLEATKLLCDTPIWGIGLDFVYGRRNLEELERAASKHIVAGVVDGRNIWRNDISASLELLERINKTVPRERIVVSTSCSLLHSPYSVKNESESAIKKYLAFACEKVEEVSLLAKLFSSGGLSEAEKSLVAENKGNVLSGSNPPLIKNGPAGDNPSGKKARDGTYRERSAIQRDRLNLPLLPATTIGSFPQTPELRKARSDYRKGGISGADYEKELKKYIDHCVAFQEEIGLDVLVHGEPERNDMVEYFGELLEGFHFTKNGWVQSYGSRCVKPPVISGDVSRPEPMTVKWIRYAQSKTKKPMKGMLTGPVTILNWSFVRNDIPRSTVAMQIALALSGEVADLQKAGITIIQVDEAAFREGYPLRKENIGEYEQWALEAFRLAVSTADASTQIHTHMCYSEFNDIIKTIEAMDADVLTVETARSGNKLLNVFKETAYQNEIGPGVYDIHSPRIPSVAEFREQIAARLEVVDEKQMWVNPDCGLKTRSWEEVRPALKNMVEAARSIRGEILHAADMP
ncbi:MAG: 5-methyltetrahydropteroyltriglutamate--homocysteine S-methyltransferase [Spirochaetaceae bacterium]|jgi:5-methyltetrahydropteroyltriglutamate--homocysteine methyltransferase|nr:5-methyltetrahydropteroyltriglutamate--homocysteine S-methyltransferase [Spirochaetaceae bacterium]